MQYGIYRRGSETSVRLADLVRPGDTPRFDEFFHAFGIPAPGKTLFDGIEEEEPIIPVPDVFYMNVPTERHVRELGQLLRESVGKATAEAVSVSGGINSAAVALLLRPKIIFSCTYGGEAYEEIEYAKLVAEAIGAEHVIVRPDAEYARRALPEIVEAVGQPIFPSSAVGCWAICEAAAARGIKSIADGTGPDELFAGYVRYALVLEEDRLARIPEFASYLPMIHRFWGVHAFERPADRYYDLLRSGGPVAGPTLDFVREEFARSDKIVNGMTRADLRLGMRGFLAMTAGCSQAHGIDWQSPLFIDPIVSKALSLPDDLKVRNGRGKWIFREALRGIVPDRILYRVDKKGWVTPVASWFGGPLEEWAAGLRRSLLNRGLTPRLDSSRGEFDQSVFQDVALELWYRRFFDSRPI